MNRPQIFDRLGTLFLVSLTLQYTFAHTIGLVHYFTRHMLPLTLLARPLTHTAILVHTHMLHS